MKRLFIVAFLMFNSWFLKAQSRITTNQYIERYASLAVREMKRTGIPASITLAQAILESDNGNSRLAKKSNNHFGIKCHNSWKGPSVRHDDDKRKECFRKYNSVYESYKDHSDFITGGTRYAFLFEYKTTDYVNWAKGLKKAGYATDKKYAALLISIIEKYELYQYDTDIEKIKPKEKRVQEAQTEAELSREVLINNRTQYIIAEAGDSYRSIADEFHMMERLLFKFNDLPKNAGITPGQRIYIKPKRNKADKGNNFHVVKEGETMYTIAQKYAIKLKKLYKLNNIETGVSLEIGQQLKLR